LLFGVLHIAGYTIKDLFPSPAQKTAFSVFLLLLVGGLISPVAEEIFFRGIIYGYLRRWSTILAILGSTALFSMAHLMTTGVTFVQIIGGLVFAVAYEKEKNLLVPITIHVLGNMAIFTLTILLVP
jgi:membrane protease YdiL (CAAX protease family)